MVVGELSASGAFDLCIALSNASAKLFPFMLVTVIAETLGKSRPQVRLRSFFGSSSTTSRFAGSAKYGSLSIIFSFMSPVRLVRLILLVR